MQCKKEIVLDMNEVNGKTFFYTDFGSEAHGRTSFRLWAYYKLVTNNKQDYLLILPIKNARVDDGKSQYTKILRPDDKLNVFHFYIECGYRGESDFVVLNDDNAKIDKYYVYHSPRGNLGISTGGLITTTKSELKIKWERSGRLYGKPSTGIIIIKLDGECYEFEEIEDIEEIEDLAG